MVLLFSFQLMGQEESAIDRAISSRKKVCLQFSNEAFINMGPDLSEQFRLELQSIADHLSMYCGSTITVMVRDSGNFGPVSEEFLYEQRYSNIQDHFIKKGIDGYRINDGKYVKDVDRDTLGAVTIWIYPDYFSLIPFKDVSEYWLDFNEPFVIEDMRFHLGKASLQDCSYKNIESIASFMEKNPGVVLEVGTHTDCRGSRHCCSNLSQRRADSIVVAIINEGIAKERLVPRGYGESVPRVIEEIDGQDTTRIVLSCEYITKFKETNKQQYEMYHQMNRRVELRILTFDYVDPRRQ